MADPTLPQVTSQCCLLTHCHGCDLDVKVLTRVDVHGDRPFIQQPAVVLDKSGAIHVPGPGIAAYSRLD
jgi:hypothetical protein